MANLRANNLTGTGGRNAITGAVFFGGDNNTGGLTIADTTDLELGSETNWTIEFWIKLNHSALSDWDVVMGKGSNDGGGVEYEWFVEVMSGDHLVFLSTGAGSPWDFNQQITPALVVGEWYHIAIVRNGSGANTLKSYVNGVQYSTHTSQNIYTGNDTFGIGHFAHTNGLNSDVTLSNVRIVKGTSVYTAAFTPPTSKLTVIPNTVLLCCNDSDDVTQEETGKTITSVGNPVATDDIPPVGVDEGVVFDGDIKVNSQGYMYFPTGDTSQRGRGTALFAGGYITPNATADIEYLSIVNGGITTKWGNLSTTQLSAGQSLSSKTRQLIGGGWTGANNNTINYITIATSGNSLEFGDLVVGRRGSSPVSNDTRGIWGGGYISPADAGTPTMDYVTIATTGNAADFGDLSGNALGGTATGSTTRGVFALGNIAPSDVNTLEYITIASTGDYTNFGDLPSGSFGRYNGSTSSNTRGIFAGGHYPTAVNIINYITIATTGDATEFGDLFLARSFPSGTSNGIRGVFMGGTANPARQDTIDSVIIATTGNAVNWGDMRVATQVQNGASSDSHGGLS